MADIEVTCPECGTEAHVSEYVSSTTVPCPGCEATITLRPDGASAGMSLAPPKKKLGLKAKEEAPEPEEGDDKPKKGRKRKKKEKEKKKKTDEEAGDEEDIPAAFRRKEKHSTQRFYHSRALQAWAWLIVLGGSVASVRYHDLLFGSPLLDENQLAWFIKGGMSCIAFCHLMVCVEAFKDDVVQGVLCLFIPLYSLHYLVNVSDLFMLRATVIGLLCAFGIDTSTFVAEHATSAYHAINSWITQTPNPEWDQ